jgi:hypothetical protein
MDFMALASQMDGFRLDEVTSGISCALRIGGCDEGDAQSIAYSPSRAPPSTSPGRGAGFGPIGALF